MAFQSEKQRRYMYARHPKIAKRWTREYGSKIRRNKPKSNPHNPYSKRKRGNPHGGY